MAAQPNYYADINASTNAICAQEGILHGMFVNSSSSGTIKIYDSLTQSGTVINNTTGVLSVGFYPLGDCAFSTGLSVTIGGTMDITLYYNYE